MTTNLIKYNELVAIEGGIHVQGGMNFEIRGSYSIVLMSTEKNAPYVDEILDEGIIKYEGEDKRGIPPELKKFVDQPMANKSGTLTQNGLFFQAAKNFKESIIEKPAIIKAYRKLRRGIWVDMGFYNLIDGFIEHDGNRKVFKFLLEPLFDEIEPKADLVHNRSIPGEVMVEVYERDGGRCTRPDCTATDNLHFDHKIPYSKGGSSKTAENIQLLCARHNLRKNNKLIY
ncbi:MAG: HNH endonuclease [SAR202 cluster bacterium]|nr:HNH endonuclease [SAR202 cluster bacterium]